LGTGTNSAEIFRRPVTKLEYVDEETLVSGSEDGTMRVWSVATGTQKEELFQALYDYTASPDVPFLPDPRSELNIKRGDVFYLIHKRPEDGWCLVSTASASAVEGWVSALPKESLAPCLAYT